MGAAPSLAKFLRSMEDEELTDTIEEVCARSRPFHKAPFTSICD